MRDYFNYIYSELFDETNKNIEIKYPHAWNGENRYKYAIIKYEDNDTVFEIEVNIHKSHPDADDQIIQDILHTIDLDPDDLFDISFRPSNSYDYEMKTGLGHVGKIFGALKIIVERFMKYENPKILVFQGKKYNKLDRGKFYSLFINRFNNLLNNIGYAKVEYDINDGKAFTLIRKDLYNKHKNEIEKLIL
mgnify:CR=1 FL=1